LLIWYLCAQTSPLFFGPSARKQIEFLTTRVLTLLVGIAKQKPKYENIIMLENCHFIQGKLQWLMGSQGAEFLEPLYTKFKELYEKHVDKYLEEIFNYNYPQLGEVRGQMRASIETRRGAVDMATLTKVYGKAFGGKVGIEKMAKRIQKHMCKEEGLGPKMCERLIVYMKDAILEIHSLKDRLFGEASILKPSRSELEEQLDRIKVDKLLKA